jgi:hypothetical protein
VPTGCAEGRAAPDGTAVARLIGTMGIARPALDRVRDDLQRGATPDLRRRRAVIGLSLVGMASMAVVPMPAREKAWCGYCIVGALASLGVCVLTLPEARRALRRPA